MTLKEKIKTQLHHLKLMGKDRRTIEKELGYSENYLDQNLSKGGTEKVYQALVDYQEQLEKHPEDQGHYSSMDVLFALQQKAEDINKQIYTQQRDFFRDILSNLKSLEQGQYLMAAMLQGGQEIIFAALAGELKGKKYPDLVDLAQNKGRVKLKKHIESGSLIADNF